MPRREEGTTEVIPHSPRRNLALLPPDILCLIAEYLRPGDVLALSMVNKHMRLTISRVLWQTVVVRPTRPESVETITDFIPSRIGIHFVRHLHFRASTAILRNPRCLHNEQPYQTTGNRMIANPATDNYWPSMYRLYACVDYIVTRVRNGQLRSFSWDMGVCLPRQIIERLRTVQPQIRCLRLTTDSRCTSAEEMEVTRSFKFQNLKHLRWVGPTCLHVLSRLVSVNCDNIEVLELDWSTCDLYMAHYTRTLSNEIHHFGWMHQERPQGGPEPGERWLGSLRHLNLSRVPLCSELFEYCLEIETLQSLTLRDCQNWGEILAQATEDREPVALTSLEIRGPVSRWDSNRHLFYSWPWMFFINGLTRLKNLYLGLELPRNVSIPFSFWSYLDNHKETLVNHVVHFRQRLNTPICGRGALDCRDLGRWGIKDDLRPFNYPKHVRSLGVSCDSGLLGKLMAPFTEWNSLRMLHVRQTEADLAVRDSEALLEPLRLSWTPLVMGRQHLRPVFCRFAQWLFGPYGVQTVEVLAFGDYAYDSALEGHNFFLVRDESHDDPKGESDASLGFRVVKTDSHEGAGIFDEWREVLTACPVADRLATAGEREYERMVETYGPTAMYNRDVDPFRQALPGPSSGALVDEEDEDENEDEDDDEDSDEDDDIYAYEDEYANDEGGYDEDGDYENGGEEDGDDNNEDDNNEDEDNGYDGGDDGENEDDDDDDDDKQSLSEEEVDSNQADGGKATKS